MDLVLVTYSAEVRKFKICAAYVEGGSYMFGINFEDRLTAICFTAGSAVPAWEFAYDLSAVSWSHQLHQPFVLSYNSSRVCYVMVQSTLDQRAFL
jgi:hypothetical protein